MKNRSAKVYFDKKLAGHIWETPSGFYFRYDKIYLSEKNNPISLTLPLRKTKFYSKKLMPFFDGLLPEGWYLNILCKTLKIDPENRFGLLLGTCRDCVGAVSIVPEK